MELSEATPLSIKEYLSITRLDGISTADVRLPVVLRLAETCSYEAMHTHQVTRLALRIFDQMRTYHRMGVTERFWLETASILHDIGWVDGWRGHHKSSLRIILQTSMLPFTNNERLVIGSVARYHRKALPDERHDHFNALSFHNRQVVKMLSAILRVADGLDTSHQSLVKDVNVKCSTRKISIVCLMDLPVAGEQKISEEKANLMELVFNRKVAITWQVGE